MHTTFIVTELQSQLSHKSGYHRFYTVSAVVADTAHCCTSLPMHTLKSAVRGLVYDKMSPSSSQTARAMF
jgi:hypothetical protein